MFYNNQFIISTKWTACVGVAKAAILLLLPMWLFSQSHWQPVGGIISNEIKTFYFDSSEQVLYMGGMFKYANGLEVNGIARWNGDQWDSVGVGQDSCENICFPVTVINKYNGDLYVGGLFEEFGGKAANNIARWNGSEWSTLSNGITRQSGTAGVRMLIEFENTLYVGGGFDSVGGIYSPNIGKWDGFDWEAMPDPGFVSAAAIYQGNLIVAGTNIFQWADTAWIPLVGIDSSYLDGSVYALAVFKGELYAGGRFTMGETTTGHSIARWDGTKWKTVGSGMHPICQDIWDNPINDMAVVNDELYIAGKFFCIDGSSKAANWIAKWDGFAWCGSQSSFYVSNPDLQNDGINTIQFYDDHLWIGGVYSKIDGVSFLEIASWPLDQDLCMPISGIELASQSRMVVFPNPFTAYTTFHFPDNIEKSFPLSVKLYDLQGKQVRQIHNITTAQFALHKKGLNAGLYFYQLWGREGVITTGKICIE